MSDSPLDQTKAVKRVLAKAGVIPETDVELEAVRLPAKDKVNMAQFATACGEVCCTNGVYMRDEVPMYLDKHDGKLKELSPGVFVSYADEQMFLYRPVPVKDAEGKITDYYKERDSMSDRAAKLVLMSPAFKRKQRQIRRVDQVRMPVLREDGSVELLQEGYDAVSKILTLPSGIEYDETISVDDARERLMRFHKDFPFADQDPDTGLSLSLAVHVSMMLTTFCLGLLSPGASVPMGVYTANDQGSGKSILAKIPQYCTQGSAGSLVFGKDEEELRKMLDMAALNASSVIFFDNVKRKLASAALDIWLTQPTWMGRYMGGQRGFNVEKQAVVLVTVNHVEVDRDAGRRGLFVNLFLEDDVNERRFDVDIDDPYLMRPEVRRELLSCLWALVRHWAAAEPEKRVRAPRQRASFEEWSRVIGGIVYAAGFGDCLEPPQLALGDTDTTDFLELMRLLAQRIVDENDGPMETHELDALLTLCDSHELFVKHVERGDGGSWKRSTSVWAGMFFKKQEGKRKIVTVTVGAKEQKRTIRLGKRGSKNLKKYDAEIVG